MVLQKFAETRNVAKVLYSEYIQKGIGLEPTLNFKSGNSEGILGDERFIEDFLRLATPEIPKKMTLEKLTEAICTHFLISPEELKEPKQTANRAEARALMALIAHKSDNITLKEVAHFLERDASGLSKHVRRLQMQIQNDTAIHKTLETLLAQL